MTERSSDRHKDAKRQWVRVPKPLTIHVVNERCICEFVEDPSAGTKAAERGLQAPAVAGTT